MQCFPVTKKKKKKVLFKILPVTVRGPKGSVNTFAMLDDGAASSLISPVIAKQIGLKGQKQLIRAKGAWTSSASQREVQNIECVISNADGEAFPLRAKIMDGFELSSQRLSKADVERYSHLRSHVNVLSFYDTKAEVLIGQDHYHLMLTEQFIKSGWDEPYATKTPLGWCVHGTIITPTSKGRFKK